MYNQIYFWIVLNTQSAYTNKDKPDMTEATYSNLLVKVKPKPIHSQAEKDYFLAEMDKLMSINEEDLTKEQLDLLEMLAILIEDYEQKHYNPPQQATPNDILKELMEAHELKQKDLLDIFGSKGIASEVINNKRSISKNQAKALGDRFHVSPALFL